MKCPKCRRDAYRFKITYSTDRYRCRGCGFAFSVERDFPDMAVRFLCLKHQGKADAFVQALVADGSFYEIDHFSGVVPRGVVLSDHDTVRHARRFRALAKRGMNIFLVYPHSGRPSLINDLWPAHELTTAQLVSAPGHVDVLRSYGYSKPLHVVGWSLCDLRPFRGGPGAVPLSVLFAPIHHSCADIDKEVNRAVMSRLLPLVRSGAIHLTVRYIHSLEGSGLHPVPGVKYVLGSQDLSTADIDLADAVIAHQTFLSLAVARGVPALGMGESIPNHSRSGNGGVYRDAPSWHLYKDLIRYPIDVLDCEDLLDLLFQACRSDDLISDWRDRMIGQPFDGKEFVRVVKSYL